MSSTSFTSSRQHQTESTVTKDMNPSLWLSDLSPEKLEQLMKIGSERLNRIAGYFIAVYLPSYEAKMEKLEAEKKENHRLEERRTTELKETFVRISQFIEENQIHTFDQYQKYEKEIDRICATNLERRRKSEESKSKKRELENDFTVGSAIKHRKCSKALSSKDVNRSESDTKLEIEEKTDMCLLMFQRVSGYCDELSQDARGKLDILKSFASDGSLNDWIMKGKGIKRLAMVTGLCELGTLIDKALTCVCSHIRMNGLDKHINWERELEDGMDISVWVDSWYPMLLSLEELYPGWFIEDLRYIWYLIAEFNDFKKESDAPKKEDFRKGFSRTGNCFFDIASDHLKLYPPPVENLEFSFTAIAETLLLDNEMTSEMRTFLS